MNTKQTKLYMKLCDYAMQRKGELRELIEDAAMMIRYLSDEKEMLKVQLNWITDRDPTPAEAEYTGDTGFIVCVSGKNGNQTYDHAIFMEEVYFEDGKWYIFGVGKPDTVTVHGWMLPPSWEEVDNGNNNSDQ